MENRIAPVLIEAWREVIASFSSKKLTAAVLPAGEEQRQADIAVTMGIIGSMQGQVFLSMDDQTGQMLASEMLGGMDVSGMDEVVKSAVGELCNMIMGTACSDLSAGIGVVDITPPNMLSSEEAASFRVQPQTCISLSLDDMGRVGFDVLIESDESAS